PLEAAPSQADSCLLRSALRPEWPVRLEPARPAGRRAAAARLQRSRLRSEIEANDCECPSASPCSRPSLCTFLDGAPPHTPARSLAGTPYPAPLSRGRAVRAVTLVGSWLPDRRRRGSRQSNHVQ